MPRITKTLDDLLRDLQKLRQNQYQGKHVSYQAAEYLDHVIMDLDIYCHEDTGLNS